MKRLALFFVFFSALSVLYGQSSQDLLPRMDSAVKNVAAALGKGFPAGDAQKITVGQWTCRDSVPALGFYWAAQLVEELVNLPGRPFTLVREGAGGADWIVSGEIIEAAGAVRVYTRLVRRGDNSIEASFHSDFEADEYFAEMLAGGSASPVIRDAYEFDGWENPRAVEIAAGSGGPPLNRTLHAENDEDFFLLVPDRDGMLVMETTGNIDTCMELYDAASREMLSDDDDGGSGGNARIRHSAAAGSRYIARVRGFDHETGGYGFRAWLAEPVRPDEYENDDDFDSAGEIGIGAVQQHTFTTGDDEDWVKFVISREGRYVIRARGVNSGRLDTCIELYGSDGNSIGEDDDGGEEYDSRLAVNLQAGNYFLKVKCLDSEPDEPYTIRVDAE